MKKLLFIDNDPLEAAEKDLVYVKQLLKYSAKLPAAMVKGIEIIPDFALLHKDEVYRILFNPQHCLCTWSMYTATHHGSLYQLTSLLAAAGRNEITGMVYVDGSGEVVQSLRGALQKSGPELLPILQAIETNYLITHQDSALFRLRLELKGLYQSPFRLEAVDLPALLA